jgi:hypothetical protein
MTHTITDDITINPPADSTADQQDQLKPHQYLLINVLIGLIPAVIFYAFAQLFVNFGVAPPWMPAAIGGTAWVAIILAAFFFQGATQGEP